MTRVRRQLKRAREGIETLEALGALFGTETSARSEPGVIDLVEVSPGVYAMPQKHARGRTMLAEAERMLSQAEQIERRASELARGRRGTR